MQQTSQKQKITLYNYIYLKLAENFQPEKIQIRVILFYDVIDYAIYTYFSVCEYKTLCFQKKGSIKPILLQ